MNERREGPPELATRDWPRECSLLGSENGPDTIEADRIGQAEKRTPAIVAAAIKDLAAEGATEAAHIASIYSRHFVEDMEIRDLWSAEHDLRGAILHLKEAAALFRKWQGEPRAAREAAP